MLVWKHNLHKFGNKLTGEFVIKYKDHLILLAKAIGLKEVCCVCVFPYILS